eukprot:gene38952-48101_t
MSFLSSGKHSILVTGGSSGIGLELTRVLLDKGHEVIAVSRSQDKLDKDKSETPNLTVFTADVSTDDGRKALFEKITSEFPQVDVLINNAGTNNYPSLLTEFKEGDWQKALREINTNLVGIVHMSTLFLSHLLAKENGLIVNVSSIQAFFPVAYTPFYAATKAGIHSFTLSLRHQLKDTSIKVVEVQPPTVNTNMPPPDERGGGIEPDEFARSVVHQMVTEGRDEITYASEHITRGGPQEWNEAFKQFNQK